MQSERLDKVLSNLGFGSRTEVKRSLGKGSVKVNGELVKDGSIKISIRDEIQYGEEIILRKPYYYFMMNKAPDCITATEDPREKTVMDYLKGRHRQMGLFPVGRLDKETEGLLIFTTNGPFAHKYTSPKHLIEKEYYAEVMGFLTDSDSKAFSTGIELDDGYITLPGKLEILEAGETSKAKVVIREGKFRQIRRMFVMLGKEVTYLRRQKMGAIDLDPSLSIGSYRELSDEEISRLEGP